MTDEQLEKIVEAIRGVVKGDVSGPAGLEGIGIALAGDKLRHPVGDAIHELASAVRELAEAIRGENGS